jgi:integrase
VTTTASAWIRKRLTRDGSKRYRVEYRLGGRETRPKYAGSFKTLREAEARKAWLAAELAARRTPDLGSLEIATKAPTLREAAERWQASRVDVRESTKVQHRTALGRLLPILGERPTDSLAPADVAELVAALVAAGKARESIRKTVTALAMVLDFAGVTPNPARDRVQVKLPLAEPTEPEPPSADHVEAAAWLLKPEYLLALVVLDASGCRVGELEAARLGDLDESRRAWLVRAAISKTRRPRWVELPADVYDVLAERLPPREDRDPEAPLFAGVTADRLRTAVGRACRDAGVPRFNVHSLRHRRISLLHRQGVDWATIGDRVGQRSRLVTADRYTHALLDAREIDRAKLLERVRTGSRGAAPGAALSV